MDDLDGSLANYVTATSPNSISPSSSSPHPTPHPSQLTNQFASFWSDASSSAQGGLKGEGAWTTVIPQELINAAAEEENYLASADSPTSSSSVPAPNIPPAPVLPRHLDKLILNVRPQISGTSSPGSGGERERRKEKEKTKRRDRDRESRTRAVPASTLGMTAALDGARDAEGALLSPPLLPITTASGTDITALAASSPPAPGEDGGPGDSPVKGKKAAIATRLDAAGLADDASVLPVPSHVVLHHLSTSAIRNGVLAVANTTRYRKKVRYLPLLRLNCTDDACFATRSISPRSTTSPHSIRYRPALRPSPPRPRPPRKRPPARVSLLIDRLRLYHYNPHTTLTPTIHCLSPSRYDALYDPLPRTHAHIRKLSTRTSTRRKQNHTVYLTRNVISIDPRVPLLRPLTSMETIDQRTPSRLPMYPSSTASPAQASSTQHYDLNILTHLIFFSPISHTPYLRAHTPTYLPPLCYVFFSCFLFAGCLPLHSSSSSSPLLSLLDACTSTTAGCQERYLVVVVVGCVLRSLVCGMWCGWVCCRCIRKVEVEG